MGVKGTGNRTGKLTDYPDYQHPKFFTESQSATEYNALLIFTPIQTK
jgi:hypothetical protein